MVLSDFKVFAGDRSHCSALSPQMIAGENG